jgi:hypothetical protein
MDFYRLKRPGSEWLTRQGDAIKAARAEKVEWEKIEVPTTKKEEMQAWLNANARDGSVTITPAELADEPLQTRPQDNTACPKCKWTPRMIEGYTERVKQSATIEGLRRWIEEREGWELTTVVEAVISRVTELAKLVGKKA